MQYSIASPNTQSISAKFNKFYIFMKNISKKSNVKIICLQETWLSYDNNIAPYQIPNYNISECKLAYNTVA